MPIPVIISEFGGLFFFYFYSYSFRCPNGRHKFKKNPSAQKKKFRFSLNAFRFKNTNGMVFIHCSAHVCLKGSNNTKCQFGCEKNKRRNRRSEDSELIDDLSKDYVIRTGLIIVTSSSSTNEGMISERLS